jgi:hypothetical protein
MLTEAKSMGSALFPGGIKSLENLLATPTLELINEHLAKLESNSQSDTHTYEVFQKYGIDIKTVRQRLKGLIAENEKFIETLQKK